MTQMQLDIYEMILGNIKNGTFKIGSLLPTEQNLSIKYSVSRPTISKVYDTLQREGYIRKRRGYGSQVIRSTSESTLTIGLLLPGGGESEIFNIINDQILKLSKKNNFDCLWEGATANNAMVRKFHLENDCNAYIEKKVDGILFSPLERVPDAEAINTKVFRKITEAHIPIILIDRSFFKTPDAKGYDIVWLDNFSAGCEMGQHHIDQGCEMIYYFYRPGSANSVHLRLAGVREKVLKNNLKFSNENILCGDPEDIDFVKKIKIIKGKTGIICANDSTAAVLLTTLEDLGTRVTKDCLISGFDNMKYAGYLKYPLTSYEQPCEEIANISVELILRRINNKNDIPLKVSLDGKIIKRESTNFYTPV